MTRLFISYATEDRSTAEQLASVLTDLGWDVWWDRRLLPGSLFDEVIEEHLDAAQAVIVMWSATSVGSEWVRAEAASAIERGVVIPVLIEPCRIPLRFRNVQTIDLSDWYGDPADSRIDRLHQALNAVTAAHEPEPTTSPDATEDPPQANREAMDLEMTAAGGAPTSSTRDVSGDRPSRQNAPPEEGRAASGRPLSWLRWWQIAAAIVLALFVAAAAYAFSTSDDDSSTPADLDQASATVEDGETESSMLAGSGATTATSDVDVSSAGDDATSGRKDGLDTGEWLYAGDERRSADDRWVLLLQDDGNLVVRDERNPSDPPIWSSGTSGIPGTRAVMQPDGNFVILDYWTDENRGPVFSTDTGGNPGATLTLQNDGAVVVRSQSGAQLFNSLVDSAES